jgi:hypothetical protein
MYWFVSRLILILGTACYSVFNSGIVFTWDPWQQLYFTPLNKCLCKFFPVFRFRIEATKRTYLCSKQRQFMYCTCNNKPCAIYVRIPLLICFCHSFKFYCFSRFMFPSVIISLLTLTVVSLIVHYFPQRLPQTSALYLLCYFVVYSHTWLLPLSRARTHAHTALIFKVLK